jgi:hypothetical protein
MGGHFSYLSLVVLMKSMKAAIRVARNPFEIQTEYLPNTSVEHSH